MDHRPPQRTPAQDFSGVMAAFERKMDQMSQRLDQMAPPSASRSQIIHSQAMSMPVTASESRVSYVNWSPGSYNSIPRVASNMEVRIPPTYRPTHPPINRDYENTRYQPEMTTNAQFEAAHQRPLLNPEVLKNDIVAQTSNYFYNPQLPPPGAAGLPPRGHFARDGYSKLQQEEPQPPDTRRSRKNWFRGSFSKKLRRNRSSSARSNSSSPERNATYRGTRTRSLRSTRDESQTREQRSKDTELQLTKALRENASAEALIQKMRKDIISLSAENEKLRVENEQLKKSIKMQNEPSTVQVSLTNRASSPVSSLLRHHSSRDDSLDVSTLTRTTNRSRTGSADLLEQADSLAHSGGAVAMKTLKVLISDEGKTSFCNSLIVRSTTSWEEFDEKMRTAFETYLSTIDQSKLNLSFSSVRSYQLGEVERVPGEAALELLPYGYCVGSVDCVLISMRDWSVKSSDYLAWKSCLPKRQLDTYLQLLTNHRKIVLVGPDHLGKEHLARLMMSHVMSMMMSQSEEASVFDARKERESILKLLLSPPNRRGGEEPCSGQALLLFNLQEVQSLGATLESVSSCRNNLSYVIGTMQSTSGSNDTFRIYKNFRWIPLSGGEPFSNLLRRVLSKNLIHQSESIAIHETTSWHVIRWLNHLVNKLSSALEKIQSNNKSVAIGPTSFMDCPIDFQQSRLWFCNLWNSDILPRMQPLISDDSNCLRPTLEWVYRTFPWNNAKDNLIPLDRTSDDTLLFSNLELPQSIPSTSTASDVFTPPEPVTPPARYDSLSRIARLTPRGGFRSRLNTNDDVFYTLESEHDSHSVEEF